MNPEIQDKKPQIFNFSRSYIREQNLKPLLQNLFAQLRDDFLNNNPINDSLSQFSAEWLRIIDKYYSPVGAHPGFPAEIRIASTERDFFHFPPSLIRNIHQGWIRIDISNTEDFQSFISHLKKMPIPAIREETLSWFPTVGQKRISGWFHTFSSSAELEFLPIYQEWNRRHRSSFFKGIPLISKNFFYYKTARFLKEIPSVESNTNNTQIQEKSTRIWSRQLLFYRCKYQRHRKILIDSVREKGQTILNCLGRIHSSVPVYSFSLIFFGLLLSHYSFSLPLNKPGSPAGKDGTMPLYGELNQSDWLSEENFAYCPASLNWQNSLYSANRIREIPDSGKRLRGLFWYEKEFDNTLYLTFDDGPNMEQILHHGSIKSVTSSILDILSEHQIRGVFFINGKNIAFQSEEQDRELRLLMIRMIREGHIIGNHSYHHYNLAESRFTDGIGDYSEVEEEFDLTQRELDRVLGFHYPLVLIRPPYAEPGRSPVLDRILVDRSMFLISLQFDTYDYAYTEEGYWQNNRIYEHVKELILPGSGGVALMHDRKNSVYLLETILSSPEINKIMDYGYLPEFLEDKYGSDNKKDSPL